MSEQAPENPTPDAPEAPQEPTSQPDNTQTSDEVSPEETESNWDPERAMTKIRKLNSENRALREREAEARQQAATVPELQQQTEALGSENLRLRVGYELGLPYNLAVRLQGSTREEMVADAETLVSLVAPKPAPTTARPIESLRPGATPANTQSEDDVLYSQLFGG